MAAALDRPAQTKPALTRLFAEHPQRGRVALVAGIEAGRSAVRTIYANFYVHGAKGSAVISTSAHTPGRTRISSL